MEKQMEGPRARLPGFESWPAVTDWEAGKNGVITANLRRAGTPELVQVKHLAQGIVANTSIRAKPKRNQQSESYLPQEHHPPATSESHKGFGEFTAPPLTEA